MTRHDCRASVRLARSVPRGATSTLLVSDGEKAVVDRGNTDCMCCCSLASLVSDTSVAATKTCVTVYSSYWSIS